MPKVSQEDLKAFGIAVKRARSLETWTLDELGGKFDPPVGKSFISKVENGSKDTLNSRTVGRFIKALKMDDSWIDKFLDTDTTQDGDETEQERKADHLFEMVKRSETIPQSSEDLLILLANKHAEGNYTDQSTAFIGLSNALEAAERIRLRGEMPRDNTGSQLNAVMAEVAKLNADGALDAANNLLDVEEKRMRDAHKANKDREDEQSRQLLEQRLDHDRLRNDPTAAADRIISDLMRQAPAGGVFSATREIKRQWDAQGERQGDPFDLRVSLMLANRNMKRAKGWQKGPALADLGHGRLAIGMRKIDLAFLHSAEKAFRAVIKASAKTESRRNQAIDQSNLGRVLCELGERENDPDILRVSVAAHRASLQLWQHEEEPNNWAIAHHSLSGSLAALGRVEQDEGFLLEAISIREDILSIRSHDITPEDRATYKLSLAITKRSLGRMKKDATLFDDAQTLYEECLTVNSPDHAVYKWANLIGGLGELALDRFALDPNPRHLDEAEKRLTDARPVMVKTHEPLAERCNDLLAQIAAARSQVG